MKCQLVPCSTSSPCSHPADRDGRHNQQKTLATPEGSAAIGQKEDFLPQQCSATSSECCPGPPSSAISRWWCRWHQPNLISKSRRIADPALQACSHWNERRHTYFVLRPSVPRSDFQSYESLSVHTEYRACRLSPSWERCDRLSKRLPSAGHSAVRKLNRCARRDCSDSAPSAVQPSSAFADTLNPPADGASVRGKDPRSAARSSEKRTCGPILLPLLVLLVSVLIAASVSCSGQSESRIRSPGSDSCWSQMRTSQILVAK